MRRTAFRSGSPVELEFLARLLERVEIAGDKFAVVAGFLLRRAIDGEGQFDMAADQVFFERSRNSISSASSPEGRRN